MELSKFSSDSANSSSGPDSRFADISGKGEDRDITIVDLIHCASHKHNELTDEQGVRIIDTNGHEQIKRRDKMSGSLETSLLTELRIL